VKKLYYITTYHHRHNLHARFLVSIPAETENAREAAVEEVWPRQEPGWSQFTSRFVCFTNDDINMEL